MTEAACAFKFNGKTDWRVSSPDDWDFFHFEMSGQEKTIGHIKIDGATCKVFKTETGQIVAIAK